MSTYPRILHFGVVPGGPRRKTGEIVILSAETPQRFRLWCSCEKQTAAAPCRHLTGVLTLLKPWYRQRTRIAEPLH